MSALAFCQCGSDWFCFVPRPENYGFPADAVQIDTVGRVIGYAGVLVCAVCGLRWEPRITDCEHCYGSGYEEYSLGHGNVDVRNCSFCEGTGRA